MLVLSASVEQTTNGWKLRT